MRTHYEMEASLGSEELRTEAIANLSNHTSPVVAFLKEEIEQSSQLLKKLAEALVEEVCVLSETLDSPVVRASTGRMNEALQVEDRIQQRLWDMACALGMLEKAIDTENYGYNHHLPISIIKELKLNEMQLALASKANLHHDVIAPYLSNEPNLGDIDLF